MQINTLINKEKKIFDQYYDKFIRSLLNTEELSKAMIYGSMNGGKRIRPFLVSFFAKFWSCLSREPGKTASYFVAAGRRRPLSLRGPVFVLAGPASGSS